VLTILAILILFAYVYPAIINYDVNVDPYINLMDSTAKHLNPAAAMEKFGSELKWILGSGGAGESTFDAIWYGSSISISLALVCAVINMVVGIAVGAVWGFSKKVDIFMTEVYNVIANVPYVLLISVIVLVMSASFWSMVFALTITGWVAIAYFIRTQVIIIRDREYNLASKCLGTPITRIATKNILPFMTSVIVTLVATEIPSYISYEVFLSFIGMGLKDMSLGKLIQAAQSAMVTPGWEIEFWSPVAVASIIAVVLYIVGQNLGDASDPRTHM
jgi:oligopeptide transport system permease protein